MIYIIFLEPKPTASTRRCKVFSQNVQLTIETMIKLSYKNLRIFDEDNTLI